MEISYQEMLIVMDDHSTKAKNKYCLLIFVVSAPCIPSIFVKIGKRDSCVSCRNK